MKIKKIDINKVKKVKPGEIRITPIDNRFYSNAPYINSKSNLPDWFRRIQKGSMSLRSCSGVSDFLELGITITAWSNFRFIPRPEHNVWDVHVDPFNPAIDYGYKPAGGFIFEQTGLCPMTSIRKIEKMSYPKLITPWRIQTAPGWSTLMLPIYYEENENYSILPAVVNTDYYQIANVVFNVKTDSEFVVRQGTPLVQLIPLQRKNDFKKIHFADESFFKYASSNMYMTGGTIPENSSTGLAYRRATKLVDDALEKKKNKWWGRSI